MHAVWCGQAEQCTTLSELISEEPQKKQSRVSVLFVQGMPKVVFEWHRSSGGEEGGDTGRCTFMCRSAVISVDVAESQKDRVRGQAERGQLEMMMEPSAGRWA